jgi:hypothetical protein
VLSMNTLCEGLCANANVKHCLHSHESGQWTLGFHRSSKSSPYNAIRNFALSVMGAFPKARNAVRRERLLR